MLRSADVFVYGKHLVNDFFVESLILVFGIGITQIVPTAAHKRVESVCVSLRISSTLWANAIHKSFVLAERRLPVRRKVYVIRQFYRELILGYCDGSAVRAMYDRYGSTPVPLTRNRPVPKTIINFYTAFTQFSETIKHRFFCFYGSKSVKFAAVNDYTVLDERQLSFLIFASDHPRYGKIELCGKLKIPGIVCGNAHDCARSVSRKAIIRNPNGNLLTCYRMSAICARKYAGFFLCRR
ncbi:uncharacterized protein BN704_00634 [Firmicutes bacterium CAG:552]|nr:uncharacterized protein BN704_00634 [Firmicutes bacterium CAG:552]